MQRRIDGAGTLGPVLFVVFLVVQAVVAPLPAPAVAMAGGYSFGVVEGFLLTWVGCLIGGVISFGISRLFGRDFVAGSARVARLDRYVEEHGAVLIFILRLIPVVSFDAISYAAGLSGIRFRSFFAATALGMLPGTFAFVYFGGFPAGLGGGPSWLAWPCWLAALTSTRGGSSGFAVASASGRGWKMEGCAHIMSCSWAS